MEHQLDLLQPTPPDGTPRVVTREGLALRYWPFWLADAASWLVQLRTDVPWRQEHITLFGRTHPIPRLTCWMGDPGCHYSYSGVRQAIEPWTASLQQLRRQVEAAAGCRFNSLLLNHYRDGSDKLDWHADDEPELDPDQPIASLSLGAARSFRLKPRQASADFASPLSFELGEGDLLVMDPPTQQHWLHQVPQRRRVARDRINLTFRMIRIPRDSKGSDCSGRSAIGERA